MQTETSSKVHKITCILILLTLFSGGLLANSTQFSLAIKAKLARDENLSDSVRVSAALDLTQFYLRSNIDSSYYWYDFSKELMRDIPNRLQYRGALLGAELVKKKGDWYEARSLLYQALNSIPENEGNARAQVMLSIGDIYCRIGNPEEGLSYFKTAESLVTDDELGRIVSLHMAECYSQLNDHIRAITTLKEIRSGLEPMEEIRRKTDIAEAYFALNKLDSALSYYRSITKRGALDFSSVPRLQANVGQGITLIRKHLYEEGVQLCDEVYTDFNLHLDYELSYDCLSCLIEGYTNLGKENLLVDLYAELIEVKDSLRERDFRYRQSILKSELDYTAGILEDSLTGKLETQFSSDIDSLKDEVQAARAGEQKSLAFALITIFIVVSTAIVLYLRDRKLKQRDRILLEEQSRQIEKQEESLEKSLAFAKRIQTAILPSPSFMQELFPKHMVYYRPKEIVAGDFYWMERTENHVFLAVADCTGHGVPGAMISVICSNALHRAVHEMKLSKSNEILDKVHEMVVGAFSKNSDQVKDGMEVALCVINRGTRYIQFSGAHRDLWLIKAGSSSVQEYKGDKDPVGKSTNKRSHKAHELVLDRGDTIYMTTDGYADQFGGSKYKKFMYGNLQKLLLELQFQSIDQRSRALHKEFNKWKRNHDQLDDVCVVGIEF